MKGDDLQFIQEDMKRENKKYSTPNMIHCFSARRKFTQLLQGLDVRARDDLKVEGIPIRNFLLGSSKQGCIQDIIYEDLPMNIHFCAKVRILILLFSIKISRR